MSEFNRCFGCMNTKTGQNPCPYCGYDENSHQESSLHIAPGFVLNERYAVGKVLGQGGFGITYLGWDITLNLIVAIKEYLPLAMATRTPDGITVSCASNDMKSDYEYGLNKFLDEARILASFSEMPNIVGARDFFSANGTAYMVMEYVDGINFKQYIERHGGKIPWEQAQSVIMFIGDALREVHAKGLLHRDISPDNIFITSKNQVKLLDFGAARAALGIQNKSVSIMLKHGYAPYEQYSTRGNQGPWTDVYALAATMYKSITGILPPEALERLEDDKLKSPSQLGLTLPQNVEFAIMKGLAVRPQDRFQNISEFQSALIDNMSSVLHAGDTVTMPVSQGRGTVCMSGNAEKTVIAPHTHSEQYTAAGQLYQTSQTNKASSSPQTPPVQKVIKPKKSSIGIIAAVVVSILIVIGGGLVYRNMSVQTPEQMLSEATELLDKKDYAKAFPLIKQAADAGLAAAQIKLAEMYLDGTAGETNASKAAGLLLPLASNNNTDALYHLGMLYLTGVGVSKNVATGINYLSKASANGHDEASYELGRIFEEGRVATKNLTKAIDYYSKCGGLRDADNRKSSIIERQEMEKERVATQIAKKQLYLEEKAEKAGKNIVKISPPSVATSSKQASISLNPSNLTLSKNSTATIIANVSPNNSKIRWSSTAPAVASVSSSGVVTAVGYGRATIKATVGNKTAECQVKIPDNSLALKVDAVRKAMANKSAEEQATINAKAKAEAQKKGISVTDALVLLLGIAGSF